MEFIRSCLLHMYIIPKAVFRLCFIIVNNVYCIPTYVVWMIMLSPLRKFNPDTYWRIEGYFFHWLLAMVSMWSWSAGYNVVETGDDITECLEARTLVISNHQSTADVPILMACFNARKNVLPNLMWIMDSLFKYTNFGIVSVLHQDFFIMSGKSKREQSVKELTRHLCNSYIPRRRNWMVLFPEGGFLRKRRAMSQKYAEQNNLPLLQYVSLPRVGAMMAIMKTVGSGSHIAAANCMANNNSNPVEADVLLEAAPLNIATVGTANAQPSSVSHQQSSPNQLAYVLDITVGYPNGEPLDLLTIVFGHRPPCRTTLHYRLYSCSDVPRFDDGDALTTWLYDRFAEKDRLLETFYRTGKFPSHSSTTIGTRCSTMSEKADLCEKEKATPAMVKRRSGDMGDDAGRLAEEGAHLLSTDTDNVIERPPHMVTQDCLRFLILHLFFITSTYVHVQMIRAVYEYANSYIFH